jgi:type I restriction enzyme M protein
MEITKELQEAINKGFIEIDEEKNKLIYKNLKNGNKVYPLKNPEEQVRLEWFLDLITKYQYEAKNIDMELSVKMWSAGKKSADLVIYYENKEKIYFSIEFKKPDITDNEFEGSILQSESYAKIIWADYFGSISWNTVRFFETKAFVREETKKDSFYTIPVKYGKPEEWNFIKWWVNDLEPVNIEILRNALSKAQQTIWKWGKRSPTEAFWEVAKLIFIKVADEKKPRKNGEPYNFQRKKNESTTKLFERINEMYEEERKRDKQVFQEKIKLDDKELAWVVEHLQRLNLNKTELDIKWEAFQLFLWWFFKWDNGQFFTPNTVTKFCIDLFAPELENTSKVLDTSCGSWGFLLKALDVMREKADEFFAEWSADHFNYWHSFAEKYLYGIEINESIARIAKMNMILHDDGHTNVISFDALEDIEKIKKDTENNEFKENSFDYIFTNPPFWAVVKNTESDYLGNFELGKTGNKVRLAQKTEILFIERFYQFLKPNGKIAVVLPDGVLTNSSLQYVREYILEHFKLLWVISLPQDAFKYYNAWVKSSVVVMQKNPLNPPYQGEIKNSSLDKGRLGGVSQQKEDYKIFMATVNKIGIDATGRTCENELPSIAQQFREFLKNPSFF